MRVTLQRKRFFTCPNGCAHEFEVEHLFKTGPGFSRPRTAGPWYCDTCGQGWMPTILEDGTVDVTPHLGVQADGTDGKMRRPLLVLEIPPQKKPIRFIVKGRQFTPEPDEDQHRYYYEEHTCPTNWLKDVHEIQIGDDADPHGLARYVGPREGPDGPKR